MATGRPVDDQAYLITGSHTPKCFPFYQYLSWAKGSFSGSCMLMSHSIQTMHDTELHLVVCCQR